MLPLGLLLLATLVRAVDDIVFTTPAVVQAGEEFTVSVNLSKASWPNPVCQGTGQCEMEYMRIYVLADPTHDTKTDRTDEMTVWRTYCYLEGCVATNLTSFNTAIPKASFPSGYPYSLDYNLFTQLENGVMATQQPVFSAFSATKFNLTGATGSWSEFAHRSADYGIEDYVYDVPCGAVPCLQKCQTKWVAPYVPYSRRKGAEMDACVEECKGDSDPMDECLTRNATAIIETATETAVSETAVSETAVSKTTLSKTTLSETATDVQASETLSKADAEATGVPDNLGYTFRAEGNSWGILLGCVAIAVGLMV